MSKIVSVHSARPGSGVTTISVNLAAILASWGQRVCLVETDFAFAEIATVLGISELEIKHTLNDYLWGKCGIENVICQISPEQEDMTNGNLFVVPASTIPGEVARILREGYDVGLFNDGIRDIAEMGFDFIFVDSAPGFAEGTLLSIANSDTVIAVSKPSRVGNRGLGIMLDVTKKLDVPQTLILLNKIHDKYYPDSILENYEKAFNVKPTALIFNSLDVEGFYEEDINGKKQRFFALAYPHHPFSQELAKCASLL